MFVLLCLKKFEYKVQRFEDFMDDEDMGEFGIVFKWIIIIERFLLEEQEIQNCCKWMVFFGNFYGVILGDFVL